MNRISCFLLLALPFVPACSSSGPADNGLAQLQGDWAVVEMNEKGKSLSPAALKRITMTFSKDQFNKIEMTTVKLINTDMSSVRVDPTKKPAEIDFVLLLEADAGKTRFGIFAIEDGKLRINVSETGGERPTGFTPGPKNTLMLLERKTS